MKNGILLGAAISFLLPFSASANSCAPASLGGYTLGASKPNSEVRLMRCHKKVGSECVTRLKRFQDNGLTYNVYFRTSDGIIYDIKAEKNKPTLEDYQYFVGLMKNDKGSPSSEGGFVAYRTQSMSNGLFTTERKKRKYLYDVKFACWGDCETQTVNEKEKRRTGQGAYLPKAVTAYIEGTQLVKANGLAISFDKKDNEQKNKMHISAACAELKAEVESLFQKSNRTGRY